MLLRVCFCICLAFFSSFYYLSIFATIGQTTFANSHENVLYSRRKLVEKICDERASDFAKSRLFIEPARNYIVDTKRSLAYCSIRKVQACLRFDFLS